MSSDRFQPSSATLLAAQAVSACATSPPAAPSAAPARKASTGKASTGKTQAGPNRRILHCWLPRFATDRIARRQPALAKQPFVIVRHDRGRRIVVAVNNVAATLNVRAGQSLADARSLCPSLLAIDADPTSDSRLLLHLARWCTRYTPWVTPDAPLNAPSGTMGEDHPFTLFEGALMLDISGCAHLAGGENALLADIAARLQAFGLVVRCAIADTPGAAWAWARHGDPARPVIPENAQKSWLSPLPAAALRLLDTDAETLMRLGITTIGDLIALPRAAVANRFQNSSITSVLYRLDQALGVAPESISPLSAPTDYSVRQHYAEPIGTPEGVAAAFERLLLALGSKLEAAGMGARQLEFTLIRADDTLDSARIGVSRPARDPAHLARLFAPRLECLDPDPGVETVILMAVSVEKFIEEQNIIQKVSGKIQCTTSEKFHPTPILDRHVRDGGQVAELIDRLSNRLGREAILRALPCEAALPEVQTLYAPALEIRAGEATTDWSAWQTPDRLTGPLLPVRLLEAPERMELAPLEPAFAERTAARDEERSEIAPQSPPGRFVWRRRPVTVTAAEGPARRLGRWWQGETAVRDYWQAEIADAGTTRRLWLYRDPAEGWAVQGLMG